MTGTDKARVRKTAAQRAQEAFDIAQRRVDRTSARVKDAEKELREAKVEDAAAVKRRDFLAGDPDLPKRSVPVAPVDPQVNVSRGQSGVVSS